MSPRLRQQWRHPPPIRPRLRRRSVRRRRVRGTVRKMRPSCSSACPWVAPARPLAWCREWTRHFPPSAGTQPSAPSMRRTWPGSSACGGRRPRALRPEGPWPRPWAATPRPLARPFAPLFPLISQPRRPFRYHLLSHSIPLETRRRTRPSCSSVYPSEAPSASSRDDTRHSPPFADTQPFAPSARWTVPWPWACKCHRPTNLCRVR
mmetsp:Transcript_35349/g.79340  ORF Transcript_35349/g.79340 Transcript_35349/m.79340 type:complete len:206 (+) Transcript_35349:1306-1923(+)